MLFPEKFVNVYFNQQVLAEAWGAKKWDVLALCVWQHTTTK